MKANRKSLCRGCADYDLDEDSCRADISLEFFNKLQCPCSICLIKSMCDDPCEPFTDYDELLTQGTKWM